MEVVGRLCLMVLVASAMPAHAQTFNMDMDKNLPAWNACVLPNCDPGGLGIPTKVVISETTKWPLDSLELSVTGPAWTNFLAWDKVGATNATYFNSDFWVTIPTSDNPSDIQALEYDIFAFNSPYEYMWGSECVSNEFWQVWDELHGQWINTTLKCSLSQNVTHHIQWWVHRVDGDTSCDGYPCMWYDMLGIDGGYTQFEIAYPSGPIPEGWSNNSGLNFQLDISGAPEKTATILEYIKTVNFTELGN